MRRHGNPPIAPTAELTKSISGAMARPLNMLNLP
jgi:hypothetical protein